MSFWLATSSPQFIWEAVGKGLATFGPGSGLLVTYANCKEAAPPAAYDIINPFSSPFWPNRNRSAWQCGKYG